MPAPALVLSCVAATLSLPTTDADVAAMSDCEVEVVTAKELMGSIYKVVEKDGKRYYEDPLRAVSISFYNRHQKVRSTQPFAEPAKRCEEQRDALGIHDDSSMCFRGSGVFLAYEVAEEVKIVPEAERIALLEEAVQRMGSPGEKLSTIFDPHWATGTIILFLPTAPETWSRPRLRMAAAFATKYKLPSAKALTALVGPAQFKCSYRPTLLAKEHLGGGRYGAARWYNVPLVNNGDNKALWGDVDCKKVPSPSADFSFVTKSSSSATPISSASIAGKRWEVVRDGRNRPLRQVKMFRLYVREAM